MEDSFAGHQDSPETLEGRGKHRLASHMCHVCGRGFVRKEHLRRHDRIHTSEKPFQCPYCFQRFSRPDARFRHVKNFCPKSVALSSRKSTAAKKRRFRVACDSCHERKQKCNGTGPCDACKKRGSDCTFTRHRNASPALDDGTSSSTPTPDPAASLLMSFVTNQEYAMQSKEDHQAGRVTAATTSFEIGTPRDSALSYQIQEATYPITEDVLAPHTLQPYAIDGLDVEGITSTLAVQDSLNLFSNEKGLENLCPPYHLDGQWDIAPWQEPMQQADAVGSNEAFIFSDLFAFSNTSPFDDVSIGTIPEFRNGTIYDMTVNLTPQKANALAILQDSCRHYAGDYLSTFQQQDSTHWLLTSASLRNYDKDIINAFLSLFSAHVADAFTTFKGFRVRLDTRLELTLAMAAVGGLFCGVPGSFNMAKAMHNASQRNFIRSTLSTVTDHNRSDISGVQIWILLILFGICSGNQRYHEICEAHYMQLYKSAFECGILDPSLSRSEEKDESRRRLICSIHVLECYRVILLQRPPGLYPSATPDLSFPGLVDTASSKTLDRPTVLSTLQYLMTPGRPLEASICSNQSLYSLASLSTLCWHAMSTSPATNTAAFPWRKDAFDLALNKWVNSHQDPPQASTLMLLHLTSIGLHVNITHIHGIARHRLAGARDPNQMKKTRELAQVWKTSEDCKIAMWHSSQIVQLAKDLTISQRPPGEEKSSTRAQQGSLSSPFDATRTADPEPPHIAFCIYLAHLILWTAVVGVSDPDIDGLNVQLDGGIYILSHLKVRVAKVFQNVLRRLKTN